MSHFLFGTNGGLQHNSKLRILQGYSGYNDSESDSFNYFPIIYGLIVGFFILIAVIGLIMRIRAMRRRRVHRAAPQTMIMGSHAGFQLSSSVSPQNYPHSYYPNQEQIVSPYPNVSYPGYQNGVDPNAYPYGVQPSYTGGTYYQQNAYNGYVQQY